MGQIYYDFAQGLNFIDPNGFNTTIFWDEITIWIQQNKFDINPFNDSRRRYHFVWN